LHGAYAFRITRRNSLLNRSTDSARLNFPAPQQQPKQLQRVFKSAFAIAPDLSPAPTHRIRGMATRKLRATPVRGSGVADPADCFPAERSAVFPPQRMKPRRRPSSSLRCRAVSDTRHGIHFGGKLDRWQSALPPRHNTSVDRALPSVKRRRHNYARSETQGCCGKYQPQQPAR